MGLGNSRWRLLFIVIVIVLLWQSSKVWFSLREEEPTVQAQLQINEGATAWKEDDAQEKIYISVYYEALCPDSRSFFTKQLVPTYHRIPQYVEVKPIPYGKATTVKKDHDYEFTCQHGPIECEANIVHACSIDAIKEPSVQLDYLSCMIKNNIKPMEIMESCAAKLNVKYDEILKCYSSGRGKELLAKYGDMTNALTPHVSFIPTITINGDTNDQVNILKNLLHEVCVRFKVMPKECMS